MFNIAEDFALFSKQISFRLDFYSLVGHPYRLEFARFLGGQKCFPGFKADSLSPVSTVYEIEIEIIYCPSLVFDYGELSNNLLPKPKFLSESSIASRQLW